MPAAKSRRTPVSDDPVLLLHKDVEALTGRLDAFEARAEKQARLTQLVEERTTDLGEDDPAAYWSHSKQLSDPQGIEDHLQHVRDVLRQHEELLGKLVERLSPLMRPLDPPMPSDMAPADSEPRSMVVIQLEEIEAHILSLSRLVDETTGRVQP